MFQTGIATTSLVGVGLCVYFVGLCLYRLFLHPLAKFPGPKLAAASRWYEAYYDIVQNGQYIWKIKELHEIYGPIIRISPYELHVNDPDFFEKLYRQEGGKWNKYAWSYDAFGVPHATICTSDHNIHRKRRAPLAPLFSKSNVSKNQDIVTSRVAKLQSRIAEFAKGKETVNIGVAVSAMTTDIATAFLLGESYDNLDRPDFNADMTDMMQGSGGMWRTTKHVRFVGPLMRAMPLSWLAKSGNRKVVAFVDYLRNSSTKVKQLVSDFNKEKHNDDAPKTLVDAILGSNLPPVEKSVQRVNDEVDTIVGAGLETVASVLRLTTYYLYRDPQLLARLRNDLEKAQNSGSGELTITQLEQIPLLTAVITEGLRLNPGVGTRLARLAPDRELVYDNRVIPRNTPVSMTILLMHFNPDIYHNPTAFNPDRWLDTEHKIDSSRHFAPFSKGTRTCLGLNLAWVEFYLTVAMMVTNFDFELNDTTSDDVDVASDQFITGTKKQNGVKVIATQITKE